MMRKIAIILFLLPIFLSAQKIDYHLEKPAKLFIGTPFQLLVDIETGLNDTIYAPEKDTLDVFILKDIVQNETIMEDKKISHLTMTFQPFDTGEFTFPKLEFTVKKGDSLSVIKTNEFTLIISSIVADSSQVIKDIAAPLKISLGFWDIFIPILVLLILIFLIRNILKVLKKNPEKKIQPVVDNRPAWEIALTELQKLKAENFLKQGEFLRFFFRYSHILRLFLELQYKFNAVEMTTTEIKQNLQLKDFTKKSEILARLKLADQVKFAKFIPTLLESEEALEWLDNYLRSFLKETKKEQKENA